LTASPPIKLTSTRCRSARQPNPGRNSTYRRGNSVQTTGASSKRQTTWPLD
jgi:putative transposase